MGEMALVSMAGTPHGVFSAPHLSSTFNAYGTWVVNLNITGANRGRVHLKLGRDIAGVAHSNLPGLREDMWRSPAGPEWAEHHVKAVSVSIKPCHQPMSLPPPTEQSSLGI